MTLLLLLRPKRDHHDPGHIATLLDNLKRRYKKKLKANPPIEVEKKSAQSLGIMRVEELEVNNDLLSAQAYDAELARTIQLRDKLLALRDALQLERWHERMRRVALAEMVLRQEVARIKQEEEDEAIMIMLWSFIDD